MKAMSRQVSKRGQITLPIELRRRWDLTESGTVELTDLGQALLVTPSSNVPVTVEDLARLAALTADLDDPDVTSGAW